MTRNDVLLSVPPLCYAMYYATCYLLHTCRRDHSTFPTPLYSIAAALYIFLFIICTFAHTFLLCTFSLLILTFYKFKFKIQSTKSCSKLTSAKAKNIVICGWEKEAYTYTSIQVTGVQYSTVYVQCSSSAPSHQRRISCSDMLSTT